MSSDFETFTGPDRRWRVPRPGGLGGLVAVIGIAIVVGLIALWPREAPPLDLTAIGFAGDTVRAEVGAVIPGPCSYSAEAECTVVEFLVIEEDSERFADTPEMEFPVEPGQPDLAPGDEVFLSVVELDDGTVAYQYADRSRWPLLIGLTLLFALAVVGLGRLRGIAALAGLALSVAILVFFILPAIVQGEDAVLVALVGGGAIAMVSLYLAHGYNPLTHVAAVGAFSALLLTVGLSALVVALADFTGLVNEEAFYLLSIPTLDLSGLLLAGLVLGAIGALDDVTVTQASAVWEVHRANPALPSEELFSAGLRVGRDHIVSTVNTLLLAYAGASLPLLILFTLSEQGLGVVASSEVVAVEIARTLVGSIGLVAAVPITTWLGSRMVPGTSRA
ncbi:MAG: YibE/F family protein [Actinobacteria bacterium]|nr:YibE/F family protein [Actinomycetota bacterium]